MLRNLKIRTKLVALLILPLVALTVFASLQVVTAQRNRTDADRVSRVAALATSLTDLVDALQRERARTLGYLASGPKHLAFGQMLADRVLVNEQRQTFEGNLAALNLSTFPKVVRDDINNASAQLIALDQERRAIDNGQGVPQVPPTPEQAERFYNTLINAFLGVNSVIAGQTNDSELARNVSAFAAIGQLKEAVSQQQGILYAALRHGTWLPGQYRLFTTAVGAEQVWTTAFQAEASPAQWALYQQTVQGADVRAANAAVNQAIQSNTHLPPPLLSQPNVDAPLVAWFTVMDSKSGLLKGVQNQVASDVGAIATRLKNQAQSRATGALTAAVLVLTVTIGLSLILARSLTRPLRTLERAANDVAERDLPSVVERLAQSDHLANLRNLEVEPVAIDSDDEIGRVAKAFNSVHSVAVRTAAEQAALRKSIGDMFINLARRSQSLIDRQLNFIEEMERAEDDPDELAKLFQLDHLATRMRRNAENLIVLSSAEVARRWSEPVALADIIRAAISEVEDFTRVELLTIDEVQVAGHAVNDVVHLLAELIENATSFSPPETPVKIAGQATPNGHLIEIEDRGLGMTDEELVQANERLANPPEIDFALSRILGFFVVGKLAQRNGIKVQLRHSWYGGVTALILIPPNLLIQPGAAATLPGDGQQRRDGYGLAELPSPGHASAGYGRATEPPTPAMAGAVRGGDTPVFEATRSDWFESGMVPTHLPLRPHKMSVGDPRASATVTSPGQRLFPTTPRPAPSAPPAAVPPYERQPTPEAGTGASPAAGEPGEPAPAAPAEAKPEPEPSALSSAPTESFPATTARAPEPEEERSWEQEPAAEAGRARPTEAPESPMGTPESPMGMGAPPEPEAPPASVEPEQPAAAEPPGVDPAAVTGPIPRPVPRRTPFTQPAPQPQPPGAGAGGAPGSRRGSGLPYRERTRGRDGAEATLGGTARFQPQARFPGSAGGSAARPGTVEPAPPPVQPQPAQVQPQLSPAGLPRRTPRANLAPGLAASMQSQSSSEVQRQPSPGAARTGTAVPGPSGRTRTPDDIRNLLTSYRAGLLHGRLDAAAASSREGARSDQQAAGRDDDGGDPG